jgi:hypothetical protein
LNVIHKLLLPPFNVNNHDLRAPKGFRMASSNNALIILLP